MNIPNLLIILIAILILGGLIAFFIIRQVKKSPKDPDEFKLKSKDSGEYQGVEYEYRYTSESQHNQASFKISVKCPAEGSFKLTKQTAFDRFFERLELTKQLKTGFDDFDDLFYINSDHTDFTAAYFTSPGKCQAAINIYNRGFKLISLNGKVIEVEKQPVKKKKEITEELIHEIVAQLIILTQDIPRDVIRAVIVESSWKAKRFVAFTIPSLIGLVGILALIFGMLDYIPLDFGALFIDSLWYSLPALFAFTWMSVQMIKGRSSSHHEFMLILVISLLSFLLAGFGGELYLNGYLDTADVTAHSALVVSKRIKESKKSKKSKSSRAYFAYVESWREGRDREKLRVSKGTYNKIVLHQTIMTIRTKPGKFEFEWLVGYEVDRDSRRQ